jgi:DNA-binding CsgD family transcriptional regulator
MAVFRLRYGAREVHLPLGTVTIGRAADCTLRIDDQWLSRHHAILRVEVDKVAIRDAGSRNGILINGIPIQTTRYLVGGDRIRLGSHELTLLRDDGVAARAADETRDDLQMLRSAPPPQPNNGGPPPPDVLSPREREVLELLAAGHTQREIAERIGVGTKSVETYRSRVAEKLGIKSRAELVRYALLHGLLRPPKV